MGPELATRASDQSLNECDVAFLRRDARGVCDHLILAVTITDRYVSKLADKAVWGCHREQRDLEAKNDLSEFNAKLK